MSKAFPKVVVISQGVRRDVGDGHRAATQVRNVLDPLPGLNRALCLTVQSQLHNVLRVVERTICEIFQSLKLPFREFEDRHEEQFVPLVAVTSRSSGQPIDGFF